MRCHLPRRQKRFGSAHTSGSRRSLRSSRRTGPITTSRTRASPSSKLSSKRSARSGWLPRRSPSFDFAAPAATATRRNESGSRGAVVHRDAKSPVPAAEPMPDHHRCDLVHRTPDCTGCPRPPAGRRYRTRPSGLFGYSDTRTCERSVRVRAGAPAAHHGQSVLSTARADAVTSSRPNRLIDTGPTRCGRSVPSRHPDVWLTNRLPAVRGLASERGASVRVSPWCGS
jgi:hypothetical protein